MHWTSTNARTVTGNPRMRELCLDSEDKNRIAFFSMNFSPLPYSNTNPALVLSFPSYSEPARPWFFWMDDKLHINYIPISLTEAVKSKFFYAILYPVKRGKELKWTNKPFVDMFGAFDRGHLASPFPCLQLKNSGTNNNILVACGQNKFYFGRWRGASNGTFSGDMPKLRQLYFFFLFYPFSNFRFYLCSQRVIVCTAWSWSCL